MVDLLHAVGATIGNAEGRAVIVDDDAAVNPVPYVSDIAPLAVLPGSPGFDLTVHGANFLPVSVVRWNGASRPTTYVSARELRAAISADDVATPRTGLVTVQTPGPGGGVSEAMPLLVTTPSTAPVLHALRHRRGGRAGVPRDGRLRRRREGRPGRRQHPGRHGLGLARERRRDVRGARRLPRPCTRPTPWRWRTSTGTGGPTSRCCTTTARGRFPSFLANADGTLGARRDFPTVAGATSSNALAVGDFNRDGRVDVALSDPAHGAVRLLLGYGDGSFLAPGYAFPVRLRLVLGGRRGLHR